MSVTDSFNPLEFDTDDDKSEEDPGDEGLGGQNGGRDFLKTVYQSFLQGKDDGFDYRKVDNDESLDDLDAEQRDAEERYFEDSDIDLDE